MSGFIEVLRTYPGLAFVSVAFPLISGLVGGLVVSYQGYLSLRDRVEADQNYKAQQIYQTKVADELAKLGPPMEALKRYESTVAAGERENQVLSLIVRQYDALQDALSGQSRLSGRKNISDADAVAEQVINTIRTVLGNPEVVNMPSGPALIIRTGPNTFRVLFAAPKFTTPRLQFNGIPSGATPNVLELSKVGFTVVFTPPSIPVEHFGFTAEAEL